MKIPAAMQCWISRLWSALPHRARTGIAAKGRHHERAAARWLARQGIEILARNLRAGPGEIDLLARDGPILIVIEVRVRSSGLLAADLSVGAHKARTLHATYRALRPKLRWPRGAPVRFDLVVGDGRGRFAHLPGALDPRSADQRTLDQL